MIYFDSDMSKSENTVVYFDWKPVIYIYVCRKYRTQCMLLMEKSVTFTGACGNEIMSSINHSFVYKAKEGRHAIISVMYMFCRSLFVLLVCSSSIYGFWLPLWYSFKLFLLIIVIGYFCTIKVLTCTNKSDIKEGRIIFLQ